MRLIADRSAELVAWAGERIPALHGQGFAEAATALGVEIDGKIAGVIVFHDYQPNYGTMQVSAAADDPRWMRARGCFDQMFRYAWEVCGVQKLYSVTPARNRRALRFVMGLGFKPEAVLTRQFGDDDAVMSSYFKEWFYDNDDARRHAAEISAAEQTRDGGAASRDAAA